MSYYCKNRLSNIGPETAWPVPAPLILLVVWSANGNGSALTSKASSNLLNNGTYPFICAGIVSSIPTNRAKCALYKKILDLLDEESISGESSGRASL